MFMKRRINMANVKQNNIFENANELENKYVSDLNFNILLNILTYVFFPIL